jgi:spore coat protein U-like protein
MKKLIISLFIMILGVSLSGAAYGGLKAANLDVTANFVAACTVSTTAVDFGNVDGTNTDGTGIITVNCPSGTQYSIFLDSGGGTSRYLRTSTAATPYELYKDSNHTDIWGDTGLGNTYTQGTSLTDNGDGTDKPHTVYGKLLYTSLPPLGTYSDVIQVSVSY